MRLEIYSLFCVKERVSEINKIINRILFNDIAKPSPPAPKPKYVGINGRRKTNRKYAN
jgi:hypothetical protein